MRAIINSLVIRFWHFEVDGNVEDIDTKKYCLWCLLQLATKKNKILMCHIAYLSKSHSLSEFLQLTLLNTLIRLSETEEKKTRLKLV